MENEQPGNQQWVEMISLGPFGGIDTTTAPYYVAPGNFVAGQNFVPNSNYGGYITVRGRTKAWQLDG